MPITSISAIDVPRYSHDEVAKYLCLPAEAVKSLLSDPENLMSFRGLVKLFISTSRDVTSADSRIETRNGEPIQLYPYSRIPSLGAPRWIVMDPEIKFGRPAVKGVPTDVIFERWRAGEQTAELAEDYGLTAEEIQEALRFETLAADFAMSATASRSRS